MKRKYSKEEIMNVIDISCFGIMFSIKKKELLKKVKENLKFLDLRKRHKIIK